MNRIFGSAPPLFSIVESTFLLVAGLINVVFLITIFFTLDYRYERLASRLKIAILLMIPFCWAFLALRPFVPLAGHFVWIAGIVVTMYSQQFANYLAMGER